ncbi:hypothetical protein NUW54_g10760 [Trametes sanguinea]|uniref:Uncharacterized protein n=1 Tax=Trametes sanguinea TaxID=158606 RepID=A0ACC1NTZ2_9APHY|nr:hypothetical protein NUW54_g10760 [Trametes sanguinea]
MSAPLAYAAEKQIAIAAVRRACVLTASVFNKLVKQETLTKGDKSPVTVGDYSAQAVVNTILGRTFPQDPIVGEEDAADLRQESGKVLKDRIIQLANETLTAPLVPGEKEEWGLGPSQAQTEEQLLDAIDRGNYEGGRTGPASKPDSGVEPYDGLSGCRLAMYAVDIAPLSAAMDADTPGRFLLCAIGDAYFFSTFKCSDMLLFPGFWTLDPIDGTKGFLRGDQYAVCLALVVDARVELGVMGCPNLPYADKARAIGESAKTLEISNFRNTVGSLKRLLGRTIDDPEIKEVEEKFTHVKLVDANGTVGAQGLFAALELFLRDFICTLNRAVLKLMKSGGSKCKLERFSLVQGEHL